MARKSSPQGEESNSVPRKRNVRIRIPYADKMALLAETAAEAEIAVDELGISDRTMRRLDFFKPHVAMLKSLPSLPMSLKRKLVAYNSVLTLQELSSICLAIAKDTLNFDSAQQRIASRVVNLASELLENEIGLERVLASSSQVRRKRETDSQQIYQFRIELAHIKPLIWRQIQVPDCSLDEFHEHLQYAMGWENCHLYLFRIYGKLFGPVEDEMDMWIDSTQIRLSDVIQDPKKQNQFVYIYDMGDSWEHEIVFEGCPEKQPKITYPRCIAGARACPPEDLGGIYGYYELLRRLAEPDAESGDESDDEFMDWARGFKPDEFSAAMMTKMMQSPPEDEE